LGRRTTGLRRNWGWAAGHYHLTHRCHDRQFLLRFAKDGDGYRHRLREAIGSVAAWLLTYNITSNDVHLMASYTSQPLNPSP